MLKFNNRVLNYNTRWLNESSQPDLPPNTIRLLYRDGVTPVFNNGGTGVQVSQRPNIWDLTYNNPVWSSLLYNHTDLLEVLGANTSDVTYMADMFRKCTSLTTVALFDTSNVTRMAAMFDYCTSLTTVPLFNTSSVTDMSYMFNSCSSLTTVPLFNTSSVTNMEGIFSKCNSLTTVPLFDTSKVTNMAWMFNNCTSLTTIPLFNTSKATEVSTMFYNCTNVESGALALYNQMSSQTVPPTNHSYTFYKCGSNTQTGAAELAQIPSDWK